RDVVGEPDIGVEVLALEIPDRSTHPATTRAEQDVQALELSEAAIEATPRDHELADQVHERVEAPDVDADGRPGRARGFGNVTGCACCGGGDRLRLAGCWLRLRGFRGRGFGRFGGPRGFRRRGGRR